VPRYDQGPVFPSAEIPLLVGNGNEVWQGGLHSSGRDPFHVERLDLSVITPGRVHNHHVQLHVAFDYDEALEEIRM
jgi:hypothetical protein